MEQNPLISVIVPVYGVEKYLDRCVQSIVDQTYQNLEIILVDDGSPDSCGAMCDVWAAKDDRIKVIHKENGGLSDARNAGMAIATGELLAFVDSDDYISPNLYRTLYERMQQDGSDIAACGVEMVWEDGTPSRMLTQPGSCVLDAEKAMRAIIEESRLKQPVWYKLYKTEQVRDIQFPVGKCHEDVFWSYRAVARAKKVSITDKIGYYYTQRGGSIMGESYSLKRLDGLEAKVHRMDFLGNHFPELLPVARIDLFFFCLYAFQMSMRHLKGEEQKHAFERVRKVRKCYGLMAADKKSLPLKHRIWAEMPLTMACHVRNWLKIGL